MSAYAYAQTRMQARYGVRPGEAVWEALHALVELPALLEQARLTPLRHWIANIAATTAPHEVERLLRARLRVLVEDTAHWLPGTWRPALRWTAVLLDLPALAHLLRGEPAYEWMRDEPLLRDLAATEPELRERVLAQGPLAVFAGRARDEPLVARWLREWRRRWPDERRERAALDALAGRVRAHRAAFESGRDAAAAWSARRALERDAVHAFRRSFLSPVAAFAWLLIAALDLERLRAEVALRARFAPTGA